MKLADRIVLRRWAPDDADSLVRLADGFIYAQLRP